LTWIQGAFFLASAGLAVFVFLKVRKMILLPDLPAEFDVWLRNAPTSNDVVQVDFGKVRDQLVTGETTAIDVNKAVVDKCNRALKNGKSFNLTLRAPFDGELILSADDRRTPVTLDTSLIDKKQSVCKVRHARTIYLRAPKGNLVINGISVESLRVGQDFPGSLTIMNARIGKLKLLSASGKKPAIAILNSNIGRIDFDQKCCGNFAVEGGAVEYITCVPPTAHNPFWGTVEFRGAPRLRSLKGPGDCDAQGYRSLSMHLMKLGNVVAAKYVQVFEKRIERPNDPGTIRFVSRMYDALSMYGNSPGRALAWLFALLIYSAVLFFVVDGAVMAESCETLSSWKVELCGDTEAARAARSIVIALDAAVNPLGLFSRIHVVEARSMVLNVYLLLVGFMSIALIAQIGIGIRRRFISR
jgi:hypothetical protein